MRKNDLLIVPSISGAWSPESVWNTGIIPSYSNSLHALAVEQCVHHLRLSDTATNSHTTPATATLWTIAP